jgi:hypothetical protein
MDEATSNLGAFEMNGIRLLGLSLCTSLTLGIPQIFSADPAPIQANETACYRERVTTQDSKAPIRSLSLPVTLVSHETRLDRCKWVDEEASCDGTTVAAVPCTVKSTTEEVLAAPSVPPLDPKLTVKQENVELRVLNAELVARLEMTQAILELQTHYTDQIVLLERQNAKLATEAAELRVKNEIQEQMTASLIERTELAGKLSAAHDWISSRTAYEASLPVQGAPTALVVNPSYEETIAGIQEDLSNLRRQLPLLKRTPVPFAFSSSIKADNTSAPTKSSSGNE